MLVPDSTTLAWHRIHGLTRTALLKSSGTTCRERTSLIKSPGAPGANSRVGSAVRLARPTMVVRFRLLPASGGAEIEAAGYVLVGHIGSAQLAAMPVPE